jgi:hypothetical protein
MPHGNGRSMTLWKGNMASKDTTSIHQRGNAMILAALVTAALALSGAVPAAMPAKGSAAATATVAGPPEPERLLFDMTADRIHEGQPAISDEDDCSLASFRCTRWG